MSKIEEKLNSLGIVLPEPAKPLAAYIPAKQTGNLVFTAGQLPLVEGNLVANGLLGRDIDVEEAKAAAQICVVNALSAVKGVIGDLDKIKQVVRVVGYVASAQEFTQQPAVINGASELLLEVFGDAGRHARSAVGVAVLPLNAAVEVELTVEI
ncbi:MAG: RidA family protein [Candidatus Nanopelagicales bacterium]